VPISLAVGELARLLKKEGIEAWLDKWHLISGDSPAASDWMSHVFLSYRHENNAHAEAVRSLGEKLRAAGLPVELDQFYMDGHPGGPDEGWRKWCEDRAEKSACVLVVCSKGWFESYQKEGPPGKGLGAALEAAVFSGEIYDEKGRNARVRLVNLDNFSEAGIPRRSKIGAFFAFSVALPNLIK
jgi:TIR domain